MNEKQMFDSKKVTEFMLAGKATFTLRSQVTGVRYTYRVRVSKPNDKGQVVHFVGVLHGPDNEAHYQYMGIIRDGLFGWTAKSKLNPKSPAVIGFDWFWNNYLRKGVMPAKLEFWHEGHCGRCGKLLTVPESIDIGIGPDCQKIMGMSAKAGQLKLVLVDMIQPSVLSKMVPVPVQAPSAEFEF